MDPSDEKLVLPEIMALHLANNQLKRHFVSLARKAS
jgi:hypothetical protein